MLIIRAGFSKQHPLPMVTSGGEKGVVSRLGFEPRTPALKGQCSTIELPAHILRNVADSKRLTAPSGRPSGVIPLASVICSLWLNHQFSKLLPVAVIFFEGREKAQRRKAGLFWESSNLEQGLVPVAFSSMGRCRIERNLPQSGRSATSVLLLMRCNPHLNSLTTFWGTA